MPGDERAPGTWPIVRCSNPFRASRFLCDVLGFTETATTIDDDHLVVLLELHWSGDQGVLLVGAHPLTQAASPSSETVVSATHLVSTEVGAVYERVLASEAEVLSPPDDPLRLAGWPASDAFTMRDPWGNLWTIGTHRGRL